MANSNLRALPKLRDSINYVYAEHAIVEQEDFSLIIIRKDGSVPIPVASTTCLLLGRPPHACGDEPSKYGDNWQKNAVCPTHVGMNRIPSTKNAGRMKSAPRMWG